MSTPISLLQMPKVPMQHIFEYLDFPSILVLRKVCHDLRNFIDDTKPPSFLKTIAVNMKIESTISLILKSSKNEIHIEYAKNEDGCVILCHKDGNAKEPILVDENFVTSFLKDFYIVLRHQKTVLEDFNIRFHLKRCAVRRRELESLKNFLKSMSHSLQVKSLDMEVDNHNEILLIFPYIDPKPLKAIHISEYPSSRGNMFNLDEIGQLEQWKQADELTIYGFRLKNLAQNVKHFSKIESLFRPFNTKELILLKEIFFSSTTLHTTNIFFIGPDPAIIKPKLIEAFGNNFLDTDRVVSWFFRIPDAIQYLNIKFRINFISFNRIEQFDVPQNAIIQN